MQRLRDSGDWDDVSASYTDEEVAKYNCAPYLYLNPESHFRFVKRTIERNVTDEVIETITPNRD